MIRIIDLLGLPDGNRDFAPPLETNPLTEEDALQEAQIIDLRLDAVAGTLAVLFDLRVALELDEGNTGVLIARGARSVKWNGPARTTPLTALSIGSSLPSTEGKLFSIDLTMWPAPGTEFSLVADSASFFVGDVTGLPRTPPNYDDATRQTISAGIAAWDSDFTPLGVVFVDR